ncbi:hypothetical protein EA187_15570 [Lujinxingia sediminis]|uniref:J domain-containing protein n=1 Tax=Lujinxingia sediminis TaxID=2480984 RepID=A0ABY0CQ54_9DELT|nr:J domain-containing protein [Lujinxingia sediminis]RVU42605.1 hypothetical protein EA187_15570 [Lujinxingia sediminis]
MIRLLIIGRPGSQWADRLHRLELQDLEIDHERLPSAGIRRFEASPADLIIIADDQGGERVEILAGAIRSRPLGQLVPLILVCPLPDPERVQATCDTLDLVAWLPPETGAETLITRIGSALDVSLRSEPPPTSPAPSEAQTHLEPPEQPATPAPTGAPPSEPSRVFRAGGLTLEALDTGATRRVDRDQIFPQRDYAHPEASVDAEVIRRKLRAVRHEDYYAILEVRRGADTQPIREAFHRLYARFDPRHIDFQIAHAFEDALMEIRDALEDAWAVLGDPTLREPYLRHTLRS